MTTAINWTDLRKKVVGENDPSLLPPKIEIPALPATVSQVCQKAKDPDCSVGDIGQLIEKDTALTCDLLKYANSSAFGLRTKVATASRAVGLLGIKKTRMFVITVAMERQMRSVKSPLIITKLFCTSALERGLFAREVAELAKLDADLAFSAAMMQDFILPTLSVQLVNKYIAFTEKLKTGDQNLATIEREAMGWDHAECAARVMLNWGFPDDLITCVRLHHEFPVLWTDSVFKNSAAMPVAMSSLLPDLMTPQFSEASRLLKVEEEWPQFDLLKIAENVETNLKELCPDLSGYTTLHARMQSCAVPAH